MASTIGRLSHKNSNRPITSPKEQENNAEKGGTIILILPLIKNHGPMKNRKDSLNYIKSMATAGKIYQDTSLEGTFVFIQDR